MVPAPRATRATAPGRVVGWHFAWLTASSCADPQVIGEGLLGEPIALMSGDASPLPRLAFVDEGCPGASAQGGCSDPQRGCQSLLIDTLTPLTTLKRSDISKPEFTRECLEIRGAAGLGAEPPSADDLDAAVARFRFLDAPMVRAPAGGTSRWTWFAGDSTSFVEPSGVLGGNVMRDFAVALRSPVDEPPTVSFYVEFPGSDRDLADQGRAFLALQFPGRLLGRDVADRCRIGDDGCRIPGFDIVRAQGNYALRSTRMVLDACVAAPPCTTRYTLQPFNPFAPGSCTATLGAELETACTPADDLARGGLRASLLVASSVPGAVLFEDSAVRMFGPLEVLPACNVATLEDRACLLAQDGLLAFSGWAPAGIETPLVRLRVRSIALVPGSTRTRDVGPCERVEDRRSALVDQCARYVEAIDREGDVRNTTPPYSADPDDDSSAGGHDDANSSLAVLGEAAILGTLERPDSALWIEVHVVPATHPLPVSLRLDLSPEAAQLDGLIGTALLRDTTTVIDYTDPNPGVRVSCLDPRSGACMVAPDCQRDAQPACCHGLPLNLLVEFIVQAEDETCCAALSAGELEEIQTQGYCAATQPP
jgi:hypothetical protein